MNLKNPIETIKEVHIEDLKSLEHPSSFIREEDYRVLILRHLSLFESGLNYESKGFIIQNETIHIYNREKSSFELLPNGFPGLLQSIVPIHNEHKKLIDGYTNEIDALEDKLYTNKISRYFMDVWFDAKKDLTKFERYYQRNILVLKDVCKEYETHKNFPKTNFYDLIEDINAYIVGIQNQLHKLDSIHHYYVSLKDDRLNKNIYYLTLISATFLPLNLVVGFFGMNTEGLFFKGDQNGTLNVLIILISTFVISSLGLKILKLIDYYIFRRLLSKYNIYNNISKKLNRILKVD